MKPTVFVITPFGEDFLALFNELKDYFQEQYEFVNAGDIDNQQNILKDIVEGISKADVIIADLTGNNPNVFYELGLAHAMNKKVIIITQDIGELPFDIRSYRAFQYSLLFYKIPDLKEELKKNLDGAIDGSVGYGNPVYDFLPNYNPIQTGGFSDESIKEEKSNSESDSEAGLLDYIGDIQQSSEEMLNEINLMGSEMDGLSEYISGTSMEIERVKSQSGNLDLSFIRKTCRKLGQPMGAFSDRLNSHVDVILAKWTVIENNYLLMLDNRLFVTDENKAGIRESVNSLVGMKESILSSNKQIELFISEMKQVLGYERSLNRAVNSLIAAFENYLQTTEQMSSSIERIVSKSNSIIGE